MPERRLSRELRIVYELARSVGSATYDVGETIERICSEVRTAFGFERAMLVRLDPESRTVHAVVQQGVDWPGEEWLMLDRFPFLLNAQQAGRAVFVRDAREEAALPSKVIERFGVHSIVAVPLMIEGKCLGFIVGDRLGGGGRFDLTEDELSFLTALGSIAAVFVERADQFAALQEALEELRHLDEAKSEFVSIASHELRTPISVVHGVAATLQRHGPDLQPEQVLELRATLYHQTARLRELAEQLLDLSQLDANAVTFVLEPFRPRERLEALLPRIVPDRIDEIEVAIEPAFELTSDPHAFERIMSNLIVNAVQYGEPPVSIGAERNAAVRVFVEDRGEGVDPEFEARLFERFTRSPESRERRQEGAGLGLAIADAYARSLGGSLAYERLRPQGSRFTLELPSESP